MEITISVAKEVESALAQKAAAQGCAVSEYVERLIERDVRQAQTFDEILAPFRQEVAESGMTDEELDALFHDARRKVFQSKQEEKVGP